MIRPVEITDQDAVLALPGADIPLWESLLAKPSGDVHHRLGYWTDDQLQAVVHAAPFGRFLHVGQLSLLGQGEPLQQVIEAIAEVAFYWVGWSKLEVDIVAHSIIRDALAATGFTVDVVRKNAEFHEDTGFQDRIYMSRFSPDFINPSPRPPPVWPPRGPHREVVLRTATVEDAAAYARIARDPTVCWATYQMATSSTDLWQQRLQAGIGQSDHIHSVVAECDGEVVGNIGLFRLTALCEHVAIIGMSVASQAQGCGIGTQLMENIIGTAVKHGIRRLQLEVTTTNTRAEALYRRFGFVPEGIRRAEVFRNGSYVDSQVMAKWLEG